MDNAMCTTSAHLNTDILCLYIYCITYNVTVSVERAEFHKQMALTGVSPSTKSSFLYRQKCLYCWLLVFSIDRVRLLDEHKTKKKQKKKINKEGRSDEIRIADKQWSLSFASCSSQYFWRQFFPSFSVDKPQHIRTENENRNEITNSVK